MRKLTKIIAPILLFFWVLASAHCELEQLPGFKFLVCCEHAETAPHQDNDCQEDACSVVESGFCTMDEHQPSVPAPLFVLIYLLPSIQSSVSTVDTMLVCPVPAPPELPRIWQFSLRAALPPRAPSLLA